MRANGKNSLGSQVDPVYRRVEWTTRHGDAKGRTRRQWWPRYVREIFGIDEPAAPRVASSLAGATSARRMRHRRRHTVPREGQDVRRESEERARRPYTSEVRETTCGPYAEERVSVCTAREMPSTHLMCPSDELVGGRMGTGVDDVAWWTYEASCRAISDRDSNNRRAY